MAKKKFFDLFPYVLEKLQYNQTDEMGELKTINRNYYVGFVWNISWSDFALRKLQLKETKDYTK